MHDFADRGALGAMRATIDRTLESRLLTHPDAVLNLGKHGATDRAMGADVLADLCRHRRIDEPGLRPLDRARPDGAHGRQPACGKARAPKEGAAIERCTTKARPECLESRPGRGGILAFDQHRAPPSVPVHVVEGQNMLAFLIASLGHLLGAFLRDGR